MMERAKQVERVVAALLANGAWKATLFVSPKLIVRATRKWYKRSSAKAKINVGLDKADIVVTIGRPNYLERTFVKACQKAGEPFPVVKVQRKFKKAR